MIRRLAPAAELPGVDVTDTRRIAASVQRLSDYFIHNPQGFTPWDQSWATEAYFAYYLPLNELRARAVVIEGEAVGFFQGLENVVDYGAGPGTASFALRARLPQFQKFDLIERSTIPARMNREKDFVFHAELSKGLIDAPGKTLFVASYSLTEGELPREARRCEALMLIEPSTQDDGRRLLELRRQLLNEGYFAWAPCPHQLECPLLSKSPRDWCHDRVHVDRPQWLIDIENHLPFRNQTVTHSYVLMRKTPPKPAAWARLVGDRQEEKGKDRQMVCRGSDREFLAWLHRQGATPDMPRGARVILPDEMKSAGNELRPGSAEIKVLGPDEN